MDAQPTSFDPIAISSLILTGIGAIAAVLAAYYAWRGPSKDDLGRVERNTQDTASHLRTVEDHLFDQRIRERVVVYASRLSISVGETHRIGEPFPLVLSLQDATVSLMAIALKNDDEMLAGEVDCVRIDERRFSASVPWKVMADWFQNGKPMDRFDTKRGVLVATFQIEGHSAYRAFSVRVRQWDREINGVGRGLEHVCTVEGSC